MSKVLDGKYKGWLIVPRRRFWLFGEERLVIAKFPSSLPLTSKTIKGWQALSESGDKDAMSMAGRALVGSFLLGPLGLLGGAATAKSKGTAVAIEFRNGKKSLVQLDPEMFAKFRFSVASSNYEGTGNTTAHSADSRSCPFCAETIKSAAIVCKHCGKDISSVSTQQQTSSIVTSNAPLDNQPAKKKGCLRIALYVIIGLILLSILGNLAGKKNSPSSSNTSAPATATP